MLSRRNIRVKVMQSLYALDRDAELTFDKVLKNYRVSLEQSFDLYLFTLKFFYDVLQHALTDEFARHSKHLPSADDRKFRALIVNNPLISSLKENHFFQVKYRSSKLASIDQDIIRRIYYDFAKKKEYLEYATSQNLRQEDHSNMLLMAYKHFNNNETFTEILDDNFGNWTDDKSLIIGTIKKTIRDLPVEGDLFQKYVPSTETTDDFGIELLNNVRKKNTELEEIIHPTLKNWDADRVAVLDMILLKMAVSELVIFPSIPKKVTLNEYLDLSKLYSTDKSKEFLNGILDRLMKELSKSGKIVKTGRGLNE